MHINCSVSCFEKKIYLYLSAVKFAELFDINFFHHFQIRNDKCRSCSLIVSPDATEFFCVMIQHWKKTLK